MASIRSFEAPHKGLRNIISMFSYNLGFTDIQNKIQLQTLKNLGNDMFALLNNHVHSENSITLKELEARVPGASSHDLADHDSLEKIQGSLQNRLSALTGNESPEEVHQFYLAFSKFHSLYLEHIYEEETVTEKLLQEHFTNEELISHRIKIMSQISPPVLVLWLKWIIPAQGIPESAALLKGFRANAPATVFETVINGIREAMHPDRFDQLLLVLEG